MATDEPVCGISRRGTCPVWGVHSGTVVAHPPDYRPAMAGRIDGGALRQMIFRWPARSSQRAHRSGRSGTLQNCRLGLEAVIPSRKAKSSKPEWRTGSKSNAVSSRVLSK